MAKKKTTNRPNPRRIRAQAARAAKHSPHLQFISYEITDEPLDTFDFPEEITKEMESIFEQCQTAPKKVITRLEELIEKYPHVPQFYNYICGAHSQLGNKEKAKHYAEKNYQINPDYLFARMNYAEICIAEKQFDKIPEIFNNKYDLKILYPERNTFHITEVVSFLCIMGKYFAGIDDVEQANVYHNILQELAPKHPFTKSLGRYISLRPMRKKISGLFGKREKAEIPS